MAALAVTPLTHGDGAGRGDGVGDDGDDGVDSASLPTFAPTQASAMPGDQFLTTLSMDAAPVRLTREQTRQKRLSVVTRTKAYPNYVPDAEPPTPDPTDESISKRRWEKLVQQWRNARLPGGGVLAQLSGRSPRSGRNASPW